MLKVLALLLSLSPGLLAGVAGLGGASAGALGVHLLHQFVIDPNIRKEERRAAEDACTIRTMDAANRAEAAERERQKAVADRALKLYQDEVAKREALRANELEAMEDEIASYEQILAGEGRSCPLSQSDVDWLRGKPGASAPAPIR